MKRLKLFFLFQAYALLALVRPTEPLDMLACAERGAAARAVGAHPLGRRAGDTISTGGWLLVLFAVALVLSWGAAFATWYFKGGVL